MNTNQNLSDDAELSATAALNQRIAEALPPLAPDEQRAPQLRSRLAARVAHSARQHGGLTTLRRGDEQWRGVVKGVRAWVLHDAGKTRSVIIQFRPGTRLPSHFSSGLSARSGLCSAITHIFTPVKSRIAPKT